MDKLEHNQETTDAFGSRQNRRSAVWSWSLFDFANSVLITNGGLYFSQWLVIDNHISETWYNVALATTSLVVLLASPLIGKRGDNGNYWWRYLWITGIVMAVCAILIPILPRAFNSVAIFVAADLFFFCLISFCYETSMLFYDALLTKLTTPETYGKISGFGFAGGWIGAIFGLAIILPFTLQGKLKLFSVPERIDCFIPAALIYFILTAISLIGLSRLRHIKTAVEPASNLARGHLWKDALQIVKQKNVLAFLVIYFLMSGAVLTIQLNMPLYLQIVMNFSDTQKAFLIAGFLFLAAIGGIVVGRFADRVGHRLMLTIVVAGWAVMLGVMIASVSKLLFLFSFASLAVLFGSMWTLLRAIFAGLAPKTQRNMYFGIYTSVDRLASVLMPLLWGYVMLIGSGWGPMRYKAAVGVMIVLICCALALVPKLKSESNLLK